MRPQSIQNHTYVDFFEKDMNPDEKKTSFYSKSKQASLFVFPDNTIGEKSFNNYVSRPQYKILPKFYTEYLGPNLDLVPDSDKLDFLSQFSTTYTAVFREILQAPHELVYVFSDLVEQSGILMFMALLKSFFGFTLVTRPQDIAYTPGRRMILLNDQVVNENFFQQLIAYFNDPANKNGQFCQVLMSTNKTKEGISLMNIQQIHIMTPSWNMADISQAMARGLRTRSHILLNDPHIRIFLHAAVPFVPVDESEDELKVLDRPPTEDELTYSIDFQRYFRSEIKEQNAKLLERVFLESSWDCMMNMEINSNTGRLIDGSRECEYSTCKYICEGMDDDTVEIGTDSTNWRFFYSTVTRDLIFQKIRQLFLTESIFHLQDIKRMVQSELVEECLYEIISMPLILKDHQGLPRFLATHGPYFFLVDNPSLPGPSKEHYYYQQNPSTRVHFSGHEMMDAYYLQNLNHLVPRLIRLIYTNHPNAKMLFESFPLVEFQQVFCEIAVQNEFMYPDRYKVGIRDWFIKNFRVDVTYIPNMHFDHRFVIDKEHPRRLHMARLDDGWSTV
jgi:hypothetical protein